MRLKSKIVKKPWGSEEWLVEGKKYALKFLNVTKGSRLSLQYHKIKEESWYILKGKIKVRYNDDEFIMKEKEILHLPTGTVHRIEAIEDSTILEVSTPELWDVVRVEDDYKRSRNEKDNDPTNAYKD